MQFGKALERILRNIVEANPSHGPVYLLKIDIADGFYRIWLNEHDILSLAVSLPPLHGDTPLVALPLVLPMGWTESPPYFTTATETVADLANQRVGVRQTTDCRCWLLHHHLRPLRTRGKRTPQRLFVDRAHRQQGGTTPGHWPMSTSL
jgi:hypothetical protein